MEAAALRISGSALKCPTIFEAEVTGIKVFSVNTEHELTSTLWLMALMTSVILLKWMAFKLSTCFRFVHLANLFTWNKRRILILVPMFTFSPSFKFSIAKGNELSYLFWINRAEVGKLVSLDPQFPPLRRSLSSQLEILSCYTSIPFICYKNL